MSHVVEVRRIGDDIAGPMGEMRTWLDVHQIEPRLFTFSVAARGVVFTLIEPGRHQRITRLYCPRQRRSVAIHIISEDLALAPAGRGPFRPLIER